MALPYESVINGLIGLGSEWITDKDKQIEFAYKMRELNFKIAESLLRTQTVPWVDATVKIIYALVALMRPIGTALMTAFGLYAHYKQIQIDPAVHAAIDGAFPAWGVSRHMNKKKEQEEQTKRERIKSNIPEYE
ncbi:MAG: hypothetical protein DBP02_02135 [gamma proteobacterium symbiont of Ctena orbiculata]|nr:MAG: hypothetical protein DBP02_02135 [gamma proteobacterium symbiont of Ctena orbiculata]